MVTWKKIIVSGSSAELQSLYVSDSITGSGAGLYNIPASSITGLQLFQITSGSVSASVDTGGNIFTVASSSNNILTLNDVGTLSLNGNLNLTNASIISSSGDLDIETVGEININPNGDFIINGNEYVEISAYGTNSDVSIGTYGSGDIDLYTSAGSVYLYGSEDIDLYTSAGSVYLYGSEDIDLFAVDGTINIYGKLDITGTDESIIDLDTNSVVKLRDSVMSLSGSSKIQIQSSASLPNDVVTVKDLGLSSIFANTGSYQATTNDLQVTGSLIVTDSIIGSFTGSYSGSIYLKQDTILLGDATNNASQVLTEPIQLDNVGSTPLTEAFLVANYSTYTNSEGDTVNTQVGQTVESTWQVAERTAAGWKISKKNEAELIKRTLDLSNTDYWDAANKRIDLFHLAGVDLVEVDTTYTAPTANAITSATPAVVTPNTSLLLQNDQLITLGGNDYMIKNIDQGVGTFELFETDGTTPVDGSTIQGDIGGTITQTNGVLSLQIDKIVGIPNNYELQIKGTDEDEISINRVAVSGATVDQIVGEATGNLTVSGRSKIKVTRDGIVNIVKLEIDVV